jgi:hypothetical protein
VTEEPPRHKGFWARHWLKALLSLVIVVGFGYLLRAGALPIVPEARQFTGIRWWTLGV